MRRLAYFLLFLTFSLFPISKGFGETPDACDKKWGHEPGDCFCGADQFIAAQRTLKVGETKVLAITYKTEPVGSHEGHDFGCWYLTTINPPSGYTLKALSFKTITDIRNPQGGGNSCEASDAVHEDARDINSFVSQQVGNEKHSQNFQECQVWCREPAVCPSPPDHAHPLPQAAAEFKYRLKGSYDKSTFVDIQLTDKPKFDIHENEKKGRHFGYAQMTLYYVPQ
jgi:hypothetical protein